MVEALKISASSGTLTIVSADKEYMRISFVSISD